MNEEEYYAVYREYCTDCGKDFKEGETVFEFAVGYHTFGGGASSIQTEESIEILCEDCEKKRGETVRVEWEMLKDMIAALKEADELIFRESGFRGFAVECALKKIEEADLAGKIRIAMPCDGKVLRGMGYDDWFEAFRPVKNHLNPEAPFGGTMFETFGDEEDYILPYTTARRVWTLTDCDGKTFVQEGMHYVNRLGYFVTDEPYVEGLTYNISIPSVEEEEDKTTEPASADEKDEDNLQCAHCSKTFEDEETGYQIEHRETTYYASDKKGVQGYFSPESDTYSEDVICGDCFDKYTDKNRKEI